MSNDFEMSEYTREDLIYEKEDLLVDHQGKAPGYHYWHQAGVDVTHAMGHGAQDRAPEDPLSNLP
jgi:NADH-quinone oxidoreductase subunit I